MLRTPEARAGGKTPQRIIRFPTLFGFPFLGFSYPFSVSRPCGGHAVLRDERSSRGKIADKHHFGAVSQRGQDLKKDACRSLRRVAA